MTLNGKENQQRVTLVARQILVNYHLYRNYSGRNLGTVVLLNRVMNASDYAKIPVSCL